MTDCGACLIVTNRSRPPGGVVVRTDGFVVHGIDGPSPVPGWIVITSERHVRGVYDFTPEEWTKVGPLIGKLMQLQKSELHAEHVYLFAIGDLLPHAHLHLVPRYADTPVHLRGRGAFDAKPNEMAEPSKIEAAVDELRRAMNE